MVTRKELEEYRSRAEEMRAMRARMRAAKLKADESDREADRARWREAEAMYDAIADEQEDALIRMGAEIALLPNADHRRAIMYRYIDGMSREAAARKMHVSSSMLDKYVRAGLEELEKE